MRTRLDGREVTRIAKLLGLALDVCDHTGKVSYTDLAPPDLLWRDNRTPEQRKQLRAAARAVLIEEARERNAKSCGPGQHTKTESRRLRHRLSAGTQRGCGHGRNP